MTDKTEPDFYEDDESPLSEGGKVERWQIEFTEDKKEFWNYLNHKNTKPVKGAALFDAIKEHTIKGFKQGVSLKSIIRMMRRKWPDADLAQHIVHDCRVWWHHELLKRPNTFGEESLANEEDREAIMAEEPSDFDGTRLEHTDDSPQGWIIRDMVPDDDAILNQGDGGAGKTTTMLQLAVAVATGREWLGLPVECGAQSVLFFSCEERTKKVRMRIKPLLYGSSAPYGDEVTWADLNNLHIVGLADRDSLIAVKDQSGRIIPTDMFEFFRKKIEKHAAKLVIIDSLYDIYGGDENTRAQVRQFVSMLRRFTARHGCALIVLGHPSLYGMSSGTGTSGSTGWRNAFRGMLYTTKTRNRKTGNETHKIESMKGNYGAPGETIELIWSDGIFVPITQEDAAASKAKTDEAAKAEFMQLLAGMVAKGRAVSDSPNASNYAPRVFGDQSDNFGKREFADAMNALFKDGAIELCGYTMANRKPGQRLEPAPGYIGPDAFEAEDDEPDFG